MPLAHYMQFSAPRIGSENYIGRQPTLLPRLKPWPKEDDGDFGFLLQIKADPAYLWLDGIEFVHLYQSVDESCDPRPIIVSLPYDSPPNDRGDVLIHPLAKPVDITFLDIMEPEELPQPSPSPEHRALFRSKLGGLDPWNNSDDRTFVGQLTESDTGLNFGGTACAIYRNHLGILEVELV